LTSAFNAAVLHVMAFDVLRLASYIGSSVLAWWIQRTKGDIAARLAFTFGLLTMSKAHGRVLRVHSCVCEEIDRQSQSSITHHHHTHTFFFLFLSFFFFFRKLCSFLSAMIVLFGHFYFLCFCTLYIPSISAVRYFEFPFVFRSSHKNFFFFFFVLFKSRCQRAPHESSASLPTAQPSPNLDYALAVAVDSAAPPTRGATRQVVAVRVCD
jgi:hypothetical protein